MTEIWDSACITQALQNKHQRDPEYQMFGAQKHRYRLNCAINPSILEKQIAKHNISLPESYMMFITEIGNGAAGPGYGLIPFELAIEGLRHADDKKELDNDFFPPTATLLPLASHGCGNASFLVIDGEHADDVWTFDSDIACYLPALHSPEDLSDYYNLSLVDYRTKVQALLSRLSNKSKVERMTFYQWYTAWLTQ